MARIIGANGRRRLVIVTDGFATFDPSQVESQFKPGMAMGPLGLTYTVNYAV